MDSAGSISFKRCTGLLLVFVSIFFISLFIGKNIIGYEVYINDKYLGCVKNKTYMKSVVEDVKKDLGDRSQLLPIEDVVKYHIAIVNKDNMESAESLNKNTLSLLDNDVNVLSMKIDDTEVAFVANENEGDLIIENLKKEYINKHGLNKDDINEFNICNKIAYENKVISFKELGTFDNTYEDFIKKIESKGDTFINTDIKVTKEENQPIARNIVINANNELYKGETKTITEGEDGEKKVKKLVSLSNGKIKDEKIIEEITIKEAKQKVIQKGTKNPIEENVAFLLPPSRGINNITSNFGKRWGRNHNGIDIAGNIGDSIFAALDGKVSFSGIQNGYGNVIIINHEDGMQTIYAHCSKLNKSVGDKVSKGDEIALVGNTGRSTGPHLHFELRVNGVPKNPLNFIQKNK